ncbi:hypothetical protein AB0E88_27015 [Streptomyces sp. NPDC028635]|uniref:hypothetical protein n=1 Tax=Streptomyces sp. NPDC028635 TaxID=3154800 RepID=UPI0033DD3C75
MRLGTDDAWLDLTRAGDDTWRVSADWSSVLAADFTACLSDAEVADFARQVLSRLGAASRAGFSAMVTPGRNNPLALKAQPVGDGFAFYVRLTPNGDDTVCHLQMELDPIPTPDLREMFDALHAALLP